MKIVPIGCLLFIAHAIPAASSVGAAQDPGPADQLKALKREYNTPNSTGTILTDEERVKFIGQGYKHHVAVSLKMVEFADRYPNDPASLEALIQACWQVNTIPWPAEVAGDDTASPQAIDRIIRRWVTSDNLGPLCERVSCGQRAEYEALLRAVLKSSPHRTVRAAASISLARYLNSRSQRVEMIREQPDRVAEYRALFGADYVDRLLRADKRRAVKEVGALFERSIKEYGDVVLPGEEKVASLAQLHLFELRNLSVGKPAPETEGLDENGVRFKLSDYRGKVVLLDFWSYV